MTTRSPAPTVRPNPAQGTALGFRPTLNRALKGRPEDESGHIGQADVWVAPSGRSSCAMKLPKAFLRAAVGCPFGAEAITAAGRGGHADRRDKA